MRCEVAERHLSALLDGERAPAAVGEHVADCARCRAFEARAHRLRHLVRLEPAAPVPDLVPEIMAAVRAEAAAGVRPMPRRRPPVWRPAAAAFAAAAVTAALVVGSVPGARRGAPPTALAEEIPRRVAAAAEEVTAYRATFDIAERSFHARVPLRTFTAEVRFGAPERFHARVTDTTAYPDDRWPRNDLLLAVSDDRWVAEGPLVCPREALPACGPGGRATVAVRGREPFDGDAPLPTDIVLPVDTLSGSERVQVVGRTQVLGRDAVVVELAYRDAAPLFGYLHASGSWRPFFPQDRVQVSLEERSWFPLAYEVLPAPSPERARWAVQNGLPPEPAGRPVLRVSARSFDPSPVTVPEPPRMTGARDGGFRDADRAGDLGLEEAPVVPADLRGLALHRLGTFTGEARPPDEVLHAYARGLAWLKIRQTRSWSGPALYGDVGELALPVPLPGGGRGYYEPATATLGRRLAIHGRGIDLYLETNLPREDLLAVAGSLPVPGRPPPDAWLVPRGSDAAPATLDEAIAEVPGLLVPTPTPEGYRLWAVELARTGERPAATLHFRRPGTEPEEEGIRLHQAPGAAFSPPLEADVQAVRVRGSTGRYSPGRGELEWMEDGVYRSLRGPGLDLATLLRVASSLEPAA